MTSENMTSSFSPANVDEEISFAHVQLFVEHLEDLTVYKAFERKLNDFSSQLNSECFDELSPTQILHKKQILWRQEGDTPPPFENHNRDIVKQLLAGLGFRVTRAGISDGTRSVLVTSRDSSGVQFIITAPAPDSAEQGQQPGYFTLAKHRRFLDVHHGHMGIGVLAFSVNNVEAIKERYETLHPALMDSYVELANNVKILEIFAYYSKHEENNQKIADAGTVLRFVQHPGDDMLYAGMGMDKVDAEFDDQSYVAYNDHWVSNVFDRTEFLDTLHDTLGFNPKVDFNAGVVAAGEAQIESTVTGNTAPLISLDKKAALRDQSQVYLPINTALSSVGHVHGFLQDIGQGIQHLASRTEDIVAFVQHANDNRKIFDEGFSFLQIPRSYYGVLTVGDLVEGNDSNGDVDRVFGEAIVNVLEATGVLSSDGAVDINMTGDNIDAILESELDAAALKVYAEVKEQMLDKICCSRYKNLFSLLGRHVSEATYLAIVRNQILVDIQGEDLLYQIFTSKILCRNPGDEAPFLEFIQRVCSECLDDQGCPQKIKPGCGGFGIRNFLTLFLSIEVSKAMHEVAEAKGEGDRERELYAQEMVDCFTSQLNESNPILTKISDAMTEEGKCQDMVGIAQGNGDEQEIIKWKELQEKAASKKAEGTAELMECSSRYNQKMRAIRQARFKE